MKTAEVFAPAKVNLTLHVTGRRDDGYHALDSLVAFAPVGDRLTLTEADTLTVDVAGPEAAGVPGGEENLVWRAARVVSPSRGAAIRVEKHLPAAAGLGGGSADAAAAIRALLQLWGETALLEELAGADLTPFARSLADLGADVPMCLLPRPLRARGIGQRTEAVPLAPLPAVLANPRVEVPTGAVFRALTHADNAPMPDDLPDLTGTQAALDFIAAGRNDLQAPAQAVAPVVGEVLDALAGLPGARVVRMSGSGATCFALFGTEAEAEAAMHALAARRPEWWIAGGTLGDQLSASMAVLS